MRSPEEVYENIVGNIRRFEALTKDHKPSKATLKRYQTHLDDISSHYEYDDSIGYLYSAFYELQALIYLAKNDSASARKFFNESVDVKFPDQDLVSQTARYWDEHQHATAEKSSASRSEERYRQTVGKSRFTKRTKIILGSVVGVIILLAIASGPISDHYTIKNADPAMLRLAKDANMTRKGELIFLRTSPQLVDDSQMAEVCSNSQSNSNGFIEQGCFVPNQSDPTTGRIYIRKMSSDLYNLEVTTAAYEMLHPAYISITEQSNGGAALNKSIESNADILSDSNLQAQIANFAKTEPGDKDLELFSILGTEYSGISSDLAAYYSPYISNLSSVVSLNDQVTQLFQNDHDQLVSLRDSIKATDAKANIAYQDSLSWAYAGNQYEDNYNYNIYVQDINLENSYVRKYNSLLDQYNILVDEYNGPQFSPENQVRSAQP